MMPIKHIKNWNACIIFCYTKKSWNKLPKRARTWDYILKSSVSIDLTADQQMTNNIVRDIPKTFLERESITSKEYHLQILVEYIKNWRNYDVSVKKLFAQWFLNDFF